MKGDNPVVASGVCLTRVQQTSRPLLTSEQGIDAQRLMSEKGTYRGVRGFSSVMGDGADHDEEKP